jgi:phage terminase large subunit-like protein
MREPLPIIDDFIGEHVKFPSGRHDDIVDASVHALTRIRELRQHDQREPVAHQLLRIRGFE